MRAATESEKHWKEGVKLSHFRINLAWFLSALARPAGLTLTLTGAVIYYIRWQEKLELPLLSVVLIISLITTLTYALCSCSSQWEKKEETLLRIDEKLSLNHQLWMAYHGAAPYPPVQALPRLFHWKLRFFLPPLLIGLLSILCAAFLPITQSAPPSHVMQEPLAWNQLEEELHSLKEEDLIQEEYLTEKEKNLEELRKQPSQEWYDHSSLEATDHLISQHKKEKQHLSEKLKQAAEQLQSMQEGVGSPGAVKAAYNEYQEAVKSMQDGQMKPNKELLSQMQEISPEMLKSLTPEELETLQKNIGDAAQKLGGDEGEDSPSDGNDDSSQGEENSPNGSGGIQRGPGHDKQLYGKTQEKVKAEAEGTLKAENLSSFTPGDLLELQDAAPEAPSESIGVRISGDAQHHGEGGNRVWKQALLPDEQEALKSFFTHDTENQ